MNPLKRKKAFRLSLANKSKTKEVIQLELEKKEPKKEVVIEEIKETKEESLSLEENLELQTNLELPKKEKKNLQVVSMLYLRKNGRMYKKKFGVRLDIKNICNKPEKNLGGKINCHMQWGVKITRGMVRNDQNIAH